MADATAGDRSDASRRDAYFDDWAGLRRRVASGDRIDASEVSLMRQGLTEDLGWTMAALRVEIGRVQNDRSLLDEGQNWIRAAEPRQLRQFFDSLADVTIVGMPSRRRALMRHRWDELLGDHSAVWQYLYSDASLEGGLVPEEGSVEAACADLPSNLRQELRLQVAWRSLQAWSTWRNRDALNLMRSDVVALTSAEASRWEYDAVMAFRLLSVGDVDGAVARIEALVRGSASRGWRRRAITWLMTAHAALSSPHGRDWLAALPEAAFTPSEATSEHEAIGSTLLAVLREPRCAKKAMRDVRDDLVRRPAQAFLVMCQFADDVHLRPVVESLLDTAEKDPTIFDRLPWTPSRQDAFVAACQKSDPPEVGFRLLALAAAHSSLPAMATGLVHVLDSIDPTLLQRLPRNELSAQLLVHQERLTASTRALVGRGLVYRAVIDGSNLCLAGTSGGRGPFRLDHLVQAFADLREAGFSEVHTYFDASTRHVAGAESAWSRVEDLQSQGHVSIVRGAADPYVIDRFLMNPEVTWIVTCDDYRDHLAAKPDLVPYWFGNRLSFHRDQTGRIVWDRRLDSAHLQLGAPQRPRAMTSLR